MQRWNGRKSPAVTIRSQEKTLKPADSDSVFMTRSCIFCLLSYKQLLDEKTLPVVNQHNVDQFQEQKREITWSTTDNAG